MKSVVVDVLCNCLFLYASNFIGFQGILPIAQVEALPDPLDELRQALSWAEPSRSAGAELRPANAPPAALPLGPGRLTQQRASGEAPGGRVEQVDRLGLGLFAPL